MSSIGTVYVERAVAGHPRTRQILERLPRARVVECERYGEVFNRRSQNFRLQKERPALILAEKHAGHLQAAPDEYDIGGERNYYFSHLLNCPYDCRYCFLQGMFRSASYVLFVNYEAFQEAIDRKLAALDGQEAFFFSGYDCDSLAFEGLTGFCAEFMPFFADRPDAWLELRTKSASLGVLESRAPASNCIVATSFTPAPAHHEWEPGVPPIERRLEALRRLGERGWPLGLRFDPLIWWPDCEASYRQLFDQVFRTLEVDWVHSVSLGAFRLPASFFRRMVDLYPEEPLFAAPLERSGSMISYREDLGNGLLDECIDALQSHVGRERLFVAGEGRRRGAAASR